MRKLVSIFVFAATLLIGLFLLPSNTPTVYEKLYPSLTQDEVSSLLGKRVANNQDGKSFIGLKYPLGMKYTLDADKPGIAEIGRDGETGIVIEVRDFLKTKDRHWQKLLGDCNLLVKWDEKSADGRNLFSCHGRFSSRMFLEFE